MIRHMTCIECPQGCHLTVDANGLSVISVAGHKCPRGGNYAKQEVEAPMRTLTTAVRTKDLELKMLPVRTNKPIPKEKLLEAMEAVKLMTLTSPVKTGSVIAENFLGLGADLRATRELGKKA